MGQAGTVLALDQGTTSSRAIVFGPDLAILGQGQREFAQHYPASGWVEHDPEDIWRTTVETARQALAAAGLAAGDIAAIGITNQRETCLVWDRRTGKPIHRAIVWQDRRTAGMCRDLKERGHEPMVTAKTGLLLDPYFSATKIAWLLDNVEGARARAEAGHLAFGTVDTFLLWRLTGGRVHATDATNASRTLLYDIAKGAFDDDLLRLFGVPRSMLPQVRDCNADYGATEPSILGAAIADPRHRRRPAGCDHRPGLLRAGHGQGDLRHRLLCPAQHRRQAGPLAQPTAHHRGLPARGQAHLCARGRNLHRRRRGAVAPRRAEGDRVGRRRAGRSRPRPIRRRTSTWCRLSSASVRPIGSRRPAAPCSASRAPPAPTRSRGRRWKPFATRRAICSRRCATTGRQKPVGAARRWRHGGERLDHAVPGRHPRCAGRASLRAGDDGAGGSLARRAQGRRVARRGRLRQALEARSRLRAGARRRRSGSASMPAGSAP